MTNATTITYDEMRSNLAKVEDAELRERVLRGIELLEKEFGPGWVDHIDPSTLTLSSTNYCVLGQVYGSAEMPEERAAEWYAAHGYWADDGYTKGLAIIDGEAEEGPSSFGFDTASHHESYRELTAAWLRALGEDQRADALTRHLSQ